SSAGWVIEVGESVVGLSPGDAIACAGAGYANHAEIVSVPVNLCAKVPDGVPLDVAAFTTIGAIALHGVRLSGASLGDRVVVIGDVPIDGPRGPLYMKELSVRVCRSYGPGRYDLDYEERGLDYPIGFVRWTEQRNMQAILDLQARGDLDLRPLVEEIVPIGE